MNMSKKNKAYQESEKHTIKSYLILSALSFYNIYQYSKMEASKALKIVLDTFGLFGGTLFFGKTYMIFQKRGQGVLYDSNIPIVSLNGKKYTLKEMVENLAKEMDMPAPSSHIVTSRQINAFALKVLDGASVYFYTETIRKANYIEKVLKKIKADNDLTTERFLNEIGLKKRKKNFDRIDQFIKPYQNGKPIDGTAYKMIEAILCHEMAHIKHNHSYKGIANFFLSKLALSNAKGYGTVIPLILSYFYMSRNHEYQADLETVIYNKEHNLIDVFNALFSSIPDSEMDVVRAVGAKGHYDLNKEENIIMDTNDRYQKIMTFMFGTHPNSDDRIYALREISNKHKV